METFNQCQTVSFTAEAFPKGCWDEMQTTLELSLKSQGYCCSESASFGSFVGCAEDKKGSRMIRACIWTSNFRHKTPPLSRGFCWGIPYFFFFFRIVSNRLQHFEHSNTFLMLNYFGVSIIHRTPTWLTRSLTGVCDLFICTYGGHNLTHGAGVKPNNNNNNG